VSRSNLWDDLRFYIDQAESIITLNHQEEVERLEKENERLREALKIIADGTWFESECMHGPYTGLQQHEIARRALEGKV
jgi:hypothetical protein